MNMSDLNEKYKKLADLIFPDITETIQDLEKRYPERNLPEGACVTRYAPSPTGFFHTGGLFTSLIDIRTARQTNGVFFLRIEDTDTKREVEGSKDSLITEMRSFGIIPDEGAISSSEEIGDYGPYTQSKREEIYKICAKNLIEKGLAYPCFCTPECLALVHAEQEKNKIRPGYYSNYARCRNISIDESIARVASGENYVLRFRSSGSHMKKVSFIDSVRGKIEIAQNDQDIVIIKKDNLPTYHFAHVVDDHFMRVTDVIRGEEWIPSAPIHIELFNALEFELPRYAHVPPVMIMDGQSKRKLSKRKDKEAAISYFVKAGYPKNSMLEYLLTIINSDYEMWRAKNLSCDMFDFEIKLSKMGSAGALFDIDKLNDVSKEVISRMSSDEVLENVLTWAKKYDNEMYQYIQKDMEYSKKIFSLERDNVKKIRKDIYKWEDIKTNFFYFFDELYNKDILEKGYIFENSNDIINMVITKYISVYDQNDDKDTWFAKMKQCAESIGFCIDMKEYKQNPDNYDGCIADYASIIRIAITNRKNTPDIYSIMQLLGKDEVMSRFQRVINR